MSVAEIKEELKSLTKAERAEVVQALLSLENEKPIQAASFAEAKAYVFDNYGDLLRRLAQ